MMFYLPFQVVQSFIIYQLQHTEDSPRICYSVLAQFDLSLYVLFNA